MFNLFTPENAKRISIKFFIVSACLIEENWQQAGESGVISSYKICTVHQTLYIGMTSRTVTWVGRLVCKRGSTNAHKILVRRREKDRPLNWPRLWFEAAIKMDHTEVEFKCKCWIQMIRTILLLVAFDVVWTCREIETSQRDTLSPSSMYFSSEHRDGIFFPIDGIDLQAYSLNTQNNNTVFFTAVRTPSVTVYNYYFYRNINFVWSLEVYDDDTTQC
jgi:hypothetical protein